MLEAIITKTKTDVIIENPQLFDKQKLIEVPLSTNNSELQEDLSQLIQNFDKMNTKEIDTITVPDEQEKISTKKDFNKLIDDEINDFIFKLKNKGIEEDLIKEKVMKYFNNNNCDYCSNDNYNNDYYNNDDNDNNNDFYNNDNYNDDYSNYFGRFFSN
jgi:hypothetical protein